MLFSCLVVIGFLVLVKRDALWRKDYIFYDMEGVCAFFLYFWI